MQRVALLLTFAAGLILPGFVSAQPASLLPEQQEKIDRLTKDVEALLAAQADLQRKLGQVTEEIGRIREDQSKASSSTAVQGVQEDTRQLAEKIKEVDRKRIHDNEVVMEELGKIGKAIKSLANTPPPVNNTPRRNETSDGGSTAGGKDKPVTKAPDQAGFEYVIQPNNTLSTIVEAYNVEFKKKNMKTITVAQVLAANPGLRPEKLSVGKKILIPSPE